MAVVEGQIPVSGTEDILDTTRVTQTDGTLVHREAVNWTDPEDPDARAAVLDTAPAAHNSDIPSVSRATNSYSLKL